MSSENDTTKRDLFRDEGGPAFPINISGWGDNGHGMSLRDWFAGKAMASGLGKRLFSDGSYMSEIAAASYRMADEMLKARGNGQ